MEFDQEGIRLISAVLTLGVAVLLGRCLAGWAGDRRNR